MVIYVIIKISNLGAGCMTTILTEHIFWNQFKSSFPKFKMNVLLKFNLQQSNPFLLFSV